MTEEQLYEKLKDLGFPIKGLMVLPNDRRDKYLTKFMDEAIQSLNWGLIVQIVKMRGEKLCWAEIKNIVEVLCKEGRFVEAIDLSNNGLQGDWLVSADLFIFQKMIEKEVSRELLKEQAERLLILLNASVPHELAPYSWEDFKRECIK